MKVNHSHIIEEKERIPRSEYWTLEASGVSDWPPIGAANDLSKWPPQKENDIQDEHNAF